LTICKEAYRSREKNPCNAYRCVVARSPVLGFEESFQE
jgi:hypothetical protein